MTEADTKIVCSKCQGIVPRGTAYCTFCGALLSAPQLRASSAQRMSPQAHIDLIEAHLVYLAKSSSPLSNAALQLHSQSKKLIEELKAAPTDKPIERGLLDRVIAWFSAANKELQGKT